MKEEETQFLVYKFGAKEGEKGYLPTNHDLRPNDDWWCAHYLFTKKSNGTFETELDEMETYGTSTSHCGGGVINRTIPKELFKLPYDDFLNEVLSLSYATHYNFTSADLKSKKGLKEFFGFN